MECSCGRLVVDGAATLPHGLRLVPTRLAGGPPGLGHDLGCDRPAGSSRPPVRRPVRHPRDESRKRRPLATPLEHPHRVGDDQLASRVQAPAAERERLPAGRGRGAVARLSVARRAAAWCFGAGAEARSRRWGTAMRGRLGAPRAAAGCSTVPEALGSGGLPVASGMKRSMCSEPSRFVRNDISSSASAKVPHPSRGARRDERSHFEQPFARRVRRPRRSGAGARPGLAPGRRPHRRVRGNARAARGSPSSDRAVPPTRLSAAAIVIPGSAAERQS